MSTITLPDPLAELLSLALAGLKQIIVDPSQPARERRLAAAVALQYVSRYEAKHPNLSTPEPPSASTAKSPQQPRPTPTDIRRAHSPAPTESSIRQTPGSGKPAPHLDADLAALVATAKSAARSAMNALAHPSG